MFKKLFNRSIKVKSLLSDDDFSFQIECYEWLLRHYGGDLFYRDTTLVLPTQECFPTLAGSESASVQSLFDCVKLYAGMRDWPCEIEAQTKNPDKHVGTFMAVQNAPNNPLGTFSVDEKQKVVIGYSPDLVKDLNRLIATFAHELAHYLTYSCPEPPPGGWDNWEFATDITAIFMGFGIFQANSSFRFQQHGDAFSQGWSTSQNGYLTEAESAFALAIFLKLKEVDPEDIFHFLKPNVKNHVKKALKELSESEAIKKLRETTII